MSVSDLKANNKKHKATKKGWFLSLFIGLIIGLSLAEIFLRVLMPNWQEFSSSRFMTIKNVSGHLPFAMGMPNFKGYFSQNNGNFRVKININSFGFREVETIDRANGRIWVIGDSMAFGWGVEENERYSSVLSNLIGEKTYNLASPGTDLCGYQAIVAQLPINLVPKSVILGLILENDVNQYECKKDAVKWHQKNNFIKNDGINLLSFNELKVLLTNNLALYNFFTVSLKRVALLKNIFISLGLIKKPHIFNIIATKTEIHSLIVSSIKEITNLKSMLPPDIPFYVLLAPTRLEIRDSDANSRFLRETITEKLSKIGISVIDPFEAFKNIGFNSTHFTHDGHWSKVGHELAAKEIAKVINKTD